MPSDPYLRARAGLPVDNPDSPDAMQGAADRATAESAGNSGGSSSPSYNFSPSTSIAAIGAVGSFLGFGYLYTNSPWFKLGVDTAADIAMHPLDVPYAVINNLDLVAAAYLGGKASTRLMRRFDNNALVVLAKFGVAAALVTTSVYTTGKYLRQIGYPVHLPQETALKHISNWGRDRTANDRTFEELHTKIRTRGNELYNERLAKPLLSIGFKCLNAECTGAGFKIDSAIPPLSVADNIERPLSDEVYKKSDHYRGLSWELSYPIDIVWKKSFRQNYLSGYMFGDSFLTLSSNNLRPNGLPERTFSYAMRVRYAFLPNETGFGLNAYEIIHTTYKASVFTGIPYSNNRGNARCNNLGDGVTFGTPENGFGPIFNSMKLSQYSCNTPESERKPFSLTEAVQTPQFKKDNTWTDTSYDFGGTVTIEVRPAMLNGQPVKSSHWRVPILGLVF